MPTSRIVTPGATSTRRSGCAARPQHRHAPPNEKPASHSAAPGQVSPVCDDRERILDLAAALVVFAAARADAAEIEAEVAARSCWKARATV